MRNAGWDIDSIALRYRGFAANSAYSSPAARMA